jgi:hypothetical protein
MKKALSFLFCAAFACCAVSAQDIQPKKGGVIDFAGYKWRVLDVQKGKALIITDEIIGKRPYHYFKDSPEERYKQRVTWADSEIRKFLNGDFYCSLGADRLRVLETAVANTDNPWFGTGGGPATLDKIFLLSIEETVKYFGDSGRLKNPPKEGAWINDKYNNARKAKYKGEYGVWWLRSVGPDFQWKDNPVHRTNAVYVLDGYIMMGGADANHYGSMAGVRPALWLNLESAPAGGQGGEDDGCAGRDVGGNVFAKNVPYATGLPETDIKYFTFEPGSWGEYIVKGNVDMINRDKLTDLVFPSAIEEGTYGFWIYAAAFANCTTLTSVIIPDNAKLSGAAFYGCTNLRSAYISYGRSAGDMYGMFGGCPNLVKVTFEKGDYDERWFPKGGLPEGLRESYYSSRGGAGTYVREPNSVVWTNIDKPAAADNPSAVKDGYFIFTPDSSGASYSVQGDIGRIKKDKVTALAIPETFRGKPVARIGPEAFSDCAGLESVALPKSVTGIGYMAFYNCASLKGIAIPQNVTLIDRYAFSHCAALESAGLPEGLIEISERAFYNCASLKEIVIPPSVAVIGEKAFYNCASLKEIAIPPSVTDFGASVFIGCANLRRVAVDPKITENVGKAAFEERSMKRERLIAYYDSIGDKNEHASHLDSIHDSSFVEYAQKSQQNLLGGSFDGNFKAVYLDKDSGGPGTYAVAVISGSPPKIDKWKRIAPGDPTPEPQVARTRPSGHAAQAAPPAAPPAPPISGMSGAGTAASPYVVTTADMLAAIASAVNGGDARYISAHYKLGNDIDLSGYGSWTPIGNGAGNSSAQGIFKGVFDGGGKVISGLTINSAVMYQGLFGRISGGAVRNLGVENVNISGGQNTGGIAGVIAGSSVISNCYTSGSITGTANVGGIAGMIHTSAIESCYSTAALSGGPSSLSGIAGASQGGTVRNSAALSPGNVVYRIANNVGGSAVFENNAAFAGMRNRSSAAFAHKVTANAENGESIAAAQIKADGTLGNRFTSANGWTTQNGRLPGFGRSREAGGHLR